MNQNGESKRKESRIEINTYLAQLKYAIEHGSAQVKLITKRGVDKGRDKRFTNGYTLAKLFPKEDYVEALKKEFLTLTIEEYIETVKDLHFPNKSEMRVFGKVYDLEDVYIKIRVELLSIDHAYGENYIMVMSFHYSDRKFVDGDFPYRKTGACDEEN